MYSVSMRVSAVGYTNMLSTENAIIFSIITDYLLSFVIYTKGFLTIPLCLHFEMNVLTQIEASHHLHLEY